MALFFFVFFFNIPIGFFNGNTNIIYWKQYGERLHKIFCILFYEVFDWEENKEVGAICFELEIPKKKKKKILETFSLSFKKKEPKIFLETCLFLQTATWQ